ncbi:MAG TPA: hypothetical protein VHP30_05415, partial [Ignavibacteriales bacterium]|nr:hypothetical protein [Ignavibacteriales bacterium]
PADGVYTMALAPAFGSVTLASLSGEYKLIIRSKDFSDEYRLIVEKDYARIEGDSTRHTKPYPFQY